MTSSSSSACPRCGGPIPVRATDELCPTCLLSGALETPDPEIQVELPGPPTVEDEDGDRTSFQGILPTEDDEDVIRFFGYDATGFFSSIDYRFANTDVTIRNNITRRITNRNGANGTVDTNLEGAGFSLFDDALAGDVHLVAGATDAIDQGVEVDEAGVDIDGETRDEGAPDLGADERR